jgi:peroxiredoxin Q/BCP
VQALTKNKTPPRRPGVRRRLVIVAVAVAALLALYAIYAQAGHKSSGSGSGAASGFRHVAGAPGIGAPAPDFTLESGTGTQVSLAGFRGKTVLLYFQEGLTCQPCWDQIRDLEQNKTALTAAGVDQVVSITTDAANLIGRKASDEHLSTPVLSDPTLQVSRAYHANNYGMMGDMRDGHSFILVGPDGTIAWRADYGGAPDYTMFLPTGKILADLSKERRQ